MKTYNNLYPTVCDFVTLHEAYQKARCLKRYRDEVLKFSHRQEQELWQLHRELSTETYRHGIYRTFVVHDAKKRHINAAPFRDRVVHKAVYLVLEPLFEQRFIFDSYACREGKGTHAAVDRLEAFIKTCREQANGGTVYVLKCDISKFFASIDQSILSELLKKHITDPALQGLLKIIIASHHEQPGKGIPIGNLTSQLFANVYLNELDQFVKHQLGERYYVRYMDDFVVVGTSKVHLHETEQRIRQYLWSHLQLELHPRKVSLQPTSKGVGFLGYRLLGTHRRLRSSTVRRFIHKVRVQQQDIARSGGADKEKERLAIVLQSWTAYANHAATWRLQRKIRILL